ncbi:hypothetical protein TNCV_4061641 [Trichonephila clavipes]|nr:hypothetical protein TNCV_4061641 [Trichonephila clavipes]
MSFTKTSYHEANHPQQFRQLTQSSSSSSTTSDSVSQNFCVFPTRKTPQPSPSKNRTSLCFCKMSGGHARTDEEGPYPSEWT